MDHLDDLKLFVRVADAGGFSKVARETGLGQPQISRAIARLEARWQTRLFQRTTRAVSLSEAGERAYAKALALLEDAEALESAVRAQDQAAVGLLRLSASVAFASAKLAPHTADFLARHPAVTVEYALSDTSIDIVAEGVDLAFRLQAPADSALQGRRMTTYKRMLVAAPSYVEREGPPKTPDDLPKGRIVSFTPNAAPSEWVLTNGEKQVVAVEARGHVRASSGPVVIDLARQGLGVALLPCFLVYPEINAGRLVHVLPDWQGPKLPLHALWAGRGLPRKARAFLDFIGPRLGGDASPD
jgi:DNA-binding transcriptional LysR family regulator